MSATQRQKLLSLLQSRRGEWIPSYEIAAEGGLQYGARLLELRRAGWVIESRTQRVRTRAHSVTVHSWFMLLTDRQAVAFALANGKKVTRERIEALRDDDQPMLFEIRKMHHDE